VFIGIAKRLIIWNFFFQKDLYFGTERVIRLNEYHFNIFKNKIQVNVIMFAVRGAYNLLTRRDTPEVVVITDLIWHKQVPLKVSVSLLACRLLRN
jgi:hypothetical protein